MKNATIEYANEIERMLNITRKKISDVEILGEKWEARLYTNHNENLRSIDVFKKGEFEWDDREYNVVFRSSESLESLLKKLDEFVLKMNDKNDLSHYF